MLASLGFAFLAGVLSTLSPCVLPLLPLVFGAAVAAHRFGTLALSAGLVLAFVGVGLFVATVGFAAGLDGGVFRWVAAILLGAVGIVLLSGRLAGLLAAATRPGQRPGEPVACRPARRGAGRTVPARDGARHRMEPLRRADAGGRLAAWRRRGAISGRSR